MFSYRNTHTGFCALLLCVLPFVFLAPSAASKSADGIPAGDLQVVLGRRSGALSIGEVLFDPGLQVVLSEVHAFYAMHDAAQTTPQQLAAALAPNHAAVTTLEARDEYVFVSEVGGDVRNVLRDWSCTIQVEDAVGEDDPLLVRLTVRRLDGETSTLESRLLSGRSFRVGREDVVGSAAELMADQSVCAVRDEVDEYLRIVDGGPAFPVDLADYLAGWTGAQDVVLDSEDIVYEYVTNPNTGETELICVRQREIDVLMAGGEEVHVTYEEVVLIF